MAGGNSLYQRDQLRPDWIIRRKEGCYGQLSLYMDPNFGLLIERKLLADKLINEFGDNEDADLLGMAKFWFHINVCTFAT
ncbi:hypothetical protein [Bifidobacterium oedipodis]|uniref:Uncharacterized protein n=1 Tax=Bifidobacterium oedipodis TaxID=2675322 RepID=A0A7Y0HT67_9BIFI|nr:hypothetical protein [Bifidobacterium sp. DSM 109957]NMM94756.1 hypothetical protein [Bifidobacterium sp. DSM 109957]